MFNPASAYTAGPYKLKLLNYYPDFAVDEKGQPITNSNEPKKPAFLFNVTGPGLSANGDIYMYFPRQVDKQSFRQDAINGALSGKIDLSVGSMDKVELASYTSYLNIRVDKAMPYIWIGAAISMIGLIMGFYWQHRRIWVRVDDGSITLGAHTNKNWFGMRKETAFALDKAGMAVEAKSLETGGTRA
jgi:cytochrome c biogenesis protein